MAVFNFSQSSVDENTKTMDTWNGSASTKPSGSGTEADPYIIASAANLAYVKNNGKTFSDKYFSQTVDINLNNKSWAGIIIKTSSHIYYQGNGHTISGINLNQGNSFFCSETGLASGSYVKNLTVIGTSTYVSLVNRGSNLIFENVVNKLNLSYNQYTNDRGGFMGSGSATFTNCSFQGSISASVSYGTEIYAGGFIGESSGTPTFTNCFNTANITVTNNYYGTEYDEEYDDVYDVYGEVRVGGFIGSGAGTFTKCYNSGNITANGSVAYAGGFVGREFNNVNCTNCYNVGTITATSSYNNNYAGGFCGSAYNGLRYLTLTNCYNGGNVVGKYEMGFAYGSGTPTISNSYYATDYTQYGYGSNTTGALTLAKLKATTDGQRPTNINSAWSTSDWYFPLNRTPELVVFKKTVKKPTLSATSKPYTGSSQTVTVNDYDTNAMTRSGTVSLSGTNVGTYQAGTYTLKAGYMWSDGKSANVILSWQITKATLATPTGLAVSTAGVLTFNAVTNATGYQYKIGSGSYSATTTSRSINLFDSLVANATAKTVYVIAIGGGNYNNSAAASVNVTLRTVTLTAGTGGSINATSRIVINNSAVSVSSNVIQFAGKQGVTPTASAGFTFSGWSVSSGNITANTTITANFAAKPLTMSNTSITTTFSTSAQTANINAASNGTGNYSYAITAGNTGSYFSISGTTLTIKASTPALSSYSLTVRATDGTSGATKDAAVTVTINRAKVTTEPSVTADLTFNTLTQSPTISFDTSKCRTTDESVTSAFHAGTYTITIEIIDKTNYEFNDGTQSKQFSWTIKQFNLGDATIGLS